MLEYALDEERYFDEDVVTKDGDVRTITRRLSIKERLTLLQGCAPFYAPTMKSVEAKASVDLTQLSYEELRAKAITMAADLLKKEHKNAH